VRRTFAFVEVKNCGNVRIWPVGAISNRASSVAGPEVIGPANTIVAPSLMVRS